MQARGVRPLAGRRDSRCEIDWRAWARGTRAGGALHGVLLLPGMGHGGRRVRGVWLFRPRLAAEDWGWGRSTVLHQKPYMI